VKLQKKIALFLVLLNFVSLYFSFSLIVFPEKKESGYYLYCLLETDDATIQSANIFVTGQDLFLMLDTFIEGKRVFAGAFIPEKEIISFFKYDLMVHVQTSEGRESYREKLLGMNGILLPLYPHEIPYHEEFIANHQVLQGEYLYKIAEEYNVDRADLEILNSDKREGLHAGDALVIGRVTFEDGPYEIRISLDFCQLALFYQDREVVSFPVAVGRGNSTPPGIYHIKRKVEDPALYWEGEYIQPLSPINGLGKWWLELNNPQYGIHGTNKPWEIGKRITHGCIRMFNDDVSLLQSLVPIGTRVVIR
jgi:hypothetical protein